MAGGNRFGSVSRMYGRGWTFAWLGGTFAGMLLAGLALPFVVGDQKSTVSVSTPSISLPGNGNDGADALESDQPQGAGDGAGGLSGTTAGGAGGAAPTAGQPGTASSPRTSAQAGGPAAAALPASDRGVTSTSIKVGVILVTSTLGERLGVVADLPSADDQKTYWQAVFDHINSQGGVGGRKLMPLYRVVDSTDTAGADATCLYFTEDEKVFAVAGSLIAQTYLECYTARHQTPLVAGGIADDELFGNRLLATIRPRTSRVIGNFAGELERLKLVQGADVGILGSDRYDPKGVAVKLMAEHAKALGAKSVSVEKITADRNAAASQVPVVVNKWRPTVDNVILLSDPLDSMTFVNHADGQSWKPKYAASDYGNNTDTDVAVAAMGRGYEGAVGITTMRHSDAKFNVAPTPAGKECERIYAERSGKPVPSSPGYRFSLRQACDYIAFLVAGIRGAGPNLTRAAWSQAMQRAGAVGTASSGGGSFGSGKFDHADLVREARFVFDCHCWQPVGDFRPGRLR